MGHFGVPFSHKNESNRATLYARLSKKFGAGYEITREDSDRYDITVLTKKSQ